MIRRVLLFAIVFAALFGMLMLVFGKEDLLHNAESKTQVQSTETRRMPAGAIRVGEQGSAAGMPASGSIAFEGPGEISPLQPAVRIGDRVWQAPEFKIAWNDSQPIGSGRYRLLRTRFTSYASIRSTTVAPAVREILVVDAASMEVVLAQKADGEVEIDSRHDILLRGVILRIPSDALGGDLGADVVVESDRMTARVEGSTMDLEAPTDELVTISTRVSSTTPPDARPQIDYRLTGYGLTAKLDEIVKNDGEVVSVGASVVRLQKDVQLVGLDRERNQSIFTLRGRGALELLPAGAERIRLTMSDDVRLDSFARTVSRDDRGREGKQGPEARDPVQAGGQRLVAWLRRDGGVRLGDVSCSDVSIFEDAYVTYGLQRLEADRFDLSLDPWHQPERLVATGAPRVHLHGSKGEVLGVLAGESRMFWDRPGLVLDTVTRALGVSFSAFEREFVGVAPLFPMETLRVEGPAKYVPARRNTKLDVPLNLARCDGGVLVCLTRHFGRLEPDLIVGRGDARFEGRLSDGVPFVAKGNRGFVVAHVPGNGEVRGSLGPFDGGQGHEFTFETGDDVISGRGSLTFRLAAEGLVAGAVREGAKPPDRSRGEVVFRAALREELRWSSKQARGDALVASGIKSLRLGRDQDELLECRATGLPIAFEVEGIKAFAAVAERTGLSTWLLTRGDEPVRVDVPRREGRAPMQLAADRVRLSVAPGFVPANEPRPEAAIFADGSVVLTSDDEVRQTVLRLTCDRLERVPSPFRGFLVGAAREALGDAGIVLAPMLFGGEAGLVHAVGSVRLQTEKRSEDGRSVASSSSFDGHSLWFDANGDALRFLLAGETKHESVFATLRDARRGDVVLEGREIAARDDGLELRATERGGCTVRFIGDSAGEDARRLRLDSSGTMRLQDTRLVVPGPVVARMVDADDVHRDGEFELRAGGDLVVHLREGYTDATRRASDTVRIALPRVVERCEAVGGVDLRYGGVEARGEELRFTPDDAWVVLRRRDGGVAVDIGDAVRVHADPQLAFNLRTFAYHGKRLRVENRQAVSRSEVGSR
ncbi:MAG: hypothetical protein H6832_12420 [Planctomycetes bacterium]|nr:hypothetical protein [Planctomycetota bacterium]MCB9919197.1 hypothetical protein [Planctomycetota bacterium]